VDFDAPVIRDGSEILSFLAATGGPRLHALRLGPLRINSVRDFEVDPSTTGVRYGRPENWQRFLALRHLVEMLNFPTERHQEDAGRSSVWGAAGSPRHKPYEAVVQSIVQGCVLACGCSHSSCTIPSFLHFVAASTYAMLKPVYPRLRRRPTWCFGAPCLACPNHLNCEGHDSSVECRTGDSWRLDTGELTDREVEFC
jgi:hypothetical protein